MRRDLERMVGRATIRKVEVLDDKGLRGSVSEFVKGLTGRRLVGFDRRGKVLILRLDNGAAVLVHPRMTGRLFALGPGQELQPHARLVLTLARGRRIVFDDMRRFGRVMMVSR